VREGGRIVREGRPSLLRLAAQSHGSKGRGAEGRLTRTSQEAKETRSGLRRGGGGGGNEGG
jgi:hypothetical protein